MLVVGDRLADCCERVSFMGGEPLLNPHVPEIARRMHGRCGLSLVTNGTLLTPETVAEIAPLLDRMSVSVDAVDQAVATACRGAAYDAERLTEGVGLVARSGVPLLKINTLVTSTNADHLPEVGRFLGSLGRRIDWKLAEPAETAFTNRGDIVPIRLERTDFLEVAQDLASRFPSLSVRTVLHDDIGDYVLVLPDGDVFIPSVNGSRPIGNVVGDLPRRFLARWGWDPSGNAETFRGKAARRAAPESGHGEQG